MGLQGASGRSFDSKSFLLSSDGSHPTSATSSSIFHKANDWVTVEENSVFQCLYTSSTKAKALYSSFLPSKPHVSASNWRNLIYRENTTARESEECSLQALTYRRAQRTLFATQHIHYKLIFFLALL